VTGIAGRIDEVVRRPDPRLEQGHCETQTGGDRQASARDERECRAHEAVEDRREGVDEAD
jgi:hypothetical protein